jgi:hypothetical protein
MDTVAAAENFLEGLAAETNGAASSHATDLPAPDQAPVQDQMNGSAPPPTEQSAPASDGTSAARRKRNRWGPAPAGDGHKDGEGENKPPVKKRRSRWEEVPETSTDTTLSLVPREITIAGGIKVSSQFFAVCPKHTSQHLTYGEPHTAILKQICQGNRIL